MASRRAHGLCLEKKKKKKSGHLRGPKAWELTGGLTFVAASGEKKGAAVFICADLGISGFEKTVP